MKRKKLFKSLLAGLMAAFMLFGFSGCGSSGSDGEISGHSDEPITIGFSPWPTNMFLQLAEEKGIFEKNGIDVELKYFSATSDSYSAFTSGSLDLCTYATADSITPFSKGVDMKIIMNTDKSMGADGLVATKDIKSIKDLKGKKIATEFYSVDHYYILLLLDQAGLTADDVELVNMSITNSGSAFIAGKVDAASVWEPTLTKAVNEGNGHLLATSKEQPDLLTDSIAASGDMIENRGEDLKAFVKSYYEAIDYYNEHKEEATKIMAQKLEVSESEFEDTIAGIHVNSVDDCIKAFTKAEDSSYVGYNNEKIATFLKEMGQIDNIPDRDSMIDDRFVKAVKAEMGNE